MSDGLPCFVQGEVIKGFGRGSKQLGIPTANFHVDVVNNVPADIKTGIYYGWAKVDDSPIYKMVMSIGWNPFYKNKQKSMETHIMYEFDDDFYGKNLKVVLLGYVRPERDFGSLDELIKTIRDDIDVAENKLESPAYQMYKSNQFFQNE